MQPEDPQADPQENRERYLPDERRKFGMALCLSGGGYRAALFHLGVLRRLNELGTLGHVETISAVSGGSILAAFLAQHVNPWPQPGERIQYFERAIAEPFRAFTKKNIRTLWILRRLFSATAAVDNLERQYTKHIVQLKLRDLPARPRFIFSATDMSFGVNWVFERDRAGSYQAGYVEPPPADWSVAKAVAASCCFPPVFEPMPIGVSPEELKGGKMRQGPRRDELVKHLALTDGGVYDNMGLEPVWKDHRVVIVSDGGGTFDATPPVGLFKRVGRYLATQGNQAAAIRKRWLIAGFVGKDPGHLRGVYLGIGSPVSHYDKAATGYSEPEVDDVISEIRTDLDCFSDAESGVLQNHGYLLADIAMRCHGTDWIDPNPPSAHVPFEAFGPGRSLAALQNSSKRRLLGRWCLRPLRLRSAQRA